MTEFNLLMLLKEARRRRVFRVAGVYVVGAFVVLQAADLALPALGLASAAIRFIWIGALLGFPIAVILGWLYDINDGQVVRVTSTDHGADLSLQRVDYLVISALAVLGLSVLLGVASELREQTTAGNSTTTARDISASSIAVLPFEDAGDDKEVSAAVAIGIQDGLLTKLSKIDGLKVISRTSVERYRNSAATVPAMGRELGVANILEGSVQVGDAKLRVNAQLIDAATDEHRWAATYDRDLTTGDIFAIQSEIVTEVVSQVGSHLVPGEDDALGALPTQNLDAYMAYLQGKSEFEKFSAGSNAAAIEHFESALAEDPEFALAYVGLAGALLESDQEFRIERAEAPLSKAFQLNKHLGEGFVVLGTLRSLQDNHAAAEEAYSTAINLEPGNARAYRYFALLRWSQDRLVEALTLMEQALDLNPNSAGINFEIARLYDMFGRFDDAISAYEKALDLEPDRYYVEVYIAALHYLARGQVDESLFWYHKGAARKQLPSGGEAATGIAYLEIGDPESASNWIERGRNHNPTNYWPLFVSTLHSVYVRDEEKTRSDALALLESVPQATAALRHLRNADLAVGHDEVARRRYARAYPELASTKTPEVTATNYKPAVDLALVLQRLGEQELADKLLLQGYQVIQDQPRLGTGGYWITDVQILALRGEKDLALAALATAVAEGWRVKTWYHFDLNPNLDSIRDEPEFQRLRALVNDDLARQAERVAELKASGDIDDLVPVSGPKQ